ncbi:Phosphatidic acid phosphatase [Phytophthora megakarya]|uniref:Phosphatidic acid phosphatase n=1 Tax=Phytophthora megakarya TaxID=4795 RepID=A0A225URS3_9STRA|nr:Phosphatidic acid phosphatase [Phytophthora megakarya]
MHLRPPSRSALLALVALISASIVTAKDAPCSSPEECCSLCGDDSERCARGPCSMNVLTRTFFSISAPTDDVGFWDVVFSFYGMVPYLVPMAIALEFIFHRRSWTRLFAFLFIPIFAIVNSGILVTSLGECSECDRPCGSCVSSNGMPSGHATNAIGLCLWLILETLLGVGKRWNVITKVAVIVGLVLLFVPVPYSRMYLGDHTELQVVIGSADGVVFGLVYFFVLRYMVGRKLPGATERMKQGRFGFLKMTNDFYVVDEDHSTNLAPLVNAEQQYVRSDST